MAAWLDEWHLFAASSSAFLLSSYSISRFLFGFIVWSHDWQKQSSADQRPRVCKCHLICICGPCRCGRVGLAAIDLHIFGEFIVGWAPEHWKMTKVNNGGRFFLMMTPLLSAILPLNVQQLPPLVTEQATVLVDAESSIIAIDYCLCEKPRNEDILIYCN